MFLVLSLVGVVLNILDPYTIFICLLLDLCKHGITIKI